MIPILFEQDATTFTTHGLGDLVDAIECVVRQADTNEFELEMLYPMTGRLFSELIPNRIIYAKINNGNHTSFTLGSYSVSYQAFRIYGFEKELNGLMRVKAQHVSYDLNDVYVMNSATSPSEYYGTPAPVYRSISARDVVTFIQNKTITGANPFTLAVSDNYDVHHTYKSVTADAPVSARSLLFDSSNSLLANYGGLCTYDSFSLRFSGQPSNVIKGIIDYGDELIDLKQEQNISEMYTGFKPYCKAKDWWYLLDSSWNGEESMVYGNIVYAQGTFNRHRIGLLDLSEYFNVDVNDPMDDRWNNLNYITYRGKQIYVPDIDRVAQNWAEINEFGVPEVNITLDYAHIKSELELYDLVKIHFQKLGIDVTSRVASTTYDVLNERNTEIEIGKSKSATWRYGDNEYSGKRTIMGDR